ncbi:hypothetical protein AAFF_G00295340 [Aldrovandia affinis]|uniref:Uncharacterized protein n=1 Tax=Aldrovandia affinis TaxID=143900 RepID=A0AAD7R9B6_9TELE|nr:hypothetical protein AAFF_G00295340 [Aldrovandia affinis]
MRQSESSPPGGRIFRPRLELTSSDNARFDCKALLRHHAVVWFDHKTDEGALQREQMLEQKLAALQRLLASAQEVSESVWQTPTVMRFRVQVVMRHSWLKNSTDSVGTQQEPWRVPNGLFHLPSEVQSAAAEWVESDTLRSGTDHTTKHTAGSRMDEQEQSEPMKPALLTEELGHGGVMLSGEGGQSVQRLSVRLREAEDQAVISQRRNAELQDVLEQKRRESQLHALESANQIQALQAQVHKLQAEVKVLRAERESVVSSSKEEVQLLRRAMEASTSAWERESAALQESVGSATAELDRWRHSAAECEQETVSLRARLQELTQRSAQAAQLQGDMQKKCAALQLECTALRADKKTLQDNMQRLEKELHSSQDQGSLLGRSVSALQRTQGELESRLAEQQDQHQQNSTRLKAQLDLAAKRTKGLQKEYEDTQVELVQVKERCCEVEQEKLSLSEELQQCRVSLRHLEERASRYEDTQVELVQVKERCCEVEQEKLSLSEELQQCRVSLRHLEERASRYEDTQVELVQVKERCCEVEQEKLSLSEELQQCRVSLRHLEERASRPSLQPLLAVLAGVVLAALLWGCSSLW